MRSNLPICMNIKGPVFLFTLTGIQGTFAGAHRPDIVSVRWEGWLCPDSTSPSVLSVFIYIKHQSTKYKLQINDTCTCCSKKKENKNKPTPNKQNPNQTNKPQNSEKTHQTISSTHLQAASREVSQKTGFNFKETSQ